MRAGDAVTVTPLSDDPGASTTPVLTVVYADDDLVAIDKPPSLPTTVGRTPGPSVAAALTAAYPEMASLGDVHHAGLVHRLDTGTSGLLIAARSPAAYARLRTEFRAKAVAKDYLAVVSGRLASAEIVDAPLARHRRSRGRMIVAKSGAKAWPARTEISPLASDGDYTLVHLRMRTGVTHQLRVHLAILGHPIIGDLRYGSVALPALSGSTETGWHFLHARRVRFDGAELPRELATAFPSHWRPLFAARGWSTELAD
ncbi:MAG: pseudouridine synthase [Candidatus Binatia bacterium]